MLHEGLTANNVNHVIPWYEGDAILWPWLARLKESTGNARWFGDTGFYFLPYLPKIFQRDASTRAICLERKKKQVIKSYLRKTVGKNHWYEHRGIGWRTDTMWDREFPSYAEEDKAKAIGLYWDYYHATAMEYCARFPGNFMLMRTAALNTSAGRLRILAFINHTEPHVIHGRFREDVSHKIRSGTKATGFKLMFGHW